MSINIGGQLMDLSEPMIMGIVNVTPDSFHDGGQIQDTEHLLKRVDQLIKNGAAIIDIGGCSTRPNAAEISQEEELNRVVPSIRAIREMYPNIPISIDSYRSAVVESAVDAGANLINDISAGNLDPKMFDTVAQLSVPYILMHMQGNPQTMQNQPHYDDIMRTLRLFFAEKINTLRGKGVADIIIDPGFGFGKTVAHNFLMLRNLKELQVLEAPILVGLSRKSMIYKTLNTSPDQALNGTTALHTIALLNGANILRVHDPQEAHEVITLMQALKQCEVLDT